MAPKLVTVLDGSEKEREKVMKDFFGLTSEQSFRDIKTDDNDCYFDGISPEFQQELDRMLPEERKALLEAEKEKCDEMKAW